MSPHAMNASPWVKGDPPGAAPPPTTTSTTSRRVGLGLGSADLSNSMAATPPRRQIGPFPTPPSFSDRENRHPRSPPRIRVSASPPSSYSTSSTYPADDSPTDFSPSHLRVNPFPPSFPSSSPRRPSSSSSSASSRLSFLRALLPKRLRPRFVPDTPPLVAPRSPSLMRPHPSTRHGPSAARRVCTPRRALLALMLLALVVALHATGVEHAKEQVQRWRGGQGHHSSAPARRPVAAFVQGAGGGEAGADGEGEQHAAAAVRAQDRPREVVRAPEMEKRPKPHRAAKFDEVPQARPAPPRPKAEEAAAKEEDAPLPFVADDAAAGKSGGDAADRPEEDKQAGLEAVVEQAEKEAARAEFELNEKLEMEKVAVKPKAKRPVKVAHKVDKVVEAIVAVPAEAEAKAQAAVDKAVTAAKKKAAAQKKKDASRYKRLLPTGVPPRRHLYGANFVLSAEDLEAQTEVEDPELTNAMVKVPTAKQLKKLFEQGKKRYAEDEDDWRAFEWKAPPADASLQRLVDKLSPVRACPLRSL